MATEYTFTKAQHNIKNCLDRFNTNATNVNTCYVQYVSQCVQQNKFHKWFQQQQPNNISFATTLLQRRFWLHQDGTHKLTKDQPTILIWNWEEILEICNQTVKTIAISRKDTNILCDSSEIFQVRWVVVLTNIIRKRHATGIA